jgi:hypothetical protein
MRSVCHATEVCQKSHHPERVLPIVIPQRFCSLLLLARIRCAVHQRFPSQSGCLPVRDFQALYVISGTSAGSTDFREYQAPNAGW